MDPGNMRVLVLADVDVFKEQLFPVLRIALMAFALSGLLRELDPNFLKTVSVFLHFAAAAGGFVIGSILDRIELVKQRV